MPWSSEKGWGWGPPRGGNSVVSPKVRIAGLVIDKIDKIMHGMELGAAGMHGQVLQWCKRGTWSHFMLFSKGFRVFLTSDHGNVEVVGVGKPSRCRCC